MRTLVADGNFKQDHLKMKNPHDDVSLSDGHGYMVGKEAFERYLLSAPPLSKPVSYFVCALSSFFTAHDDTSEIHMQ